MSFTQIKRIKEIDSTPEQAIASYGSFVKYMNKTAARIAKCSRRDWTPDRISYSKGCNSVATIHAAIQVKFGSDVMFTAINTHPFDH